VILSSRHGIYAWPWTVQAALQTRWHQHIPTLPIGAYTSNLTVSDSCKSFRNRHTECNFVQKLDFEKDVKQTHIMKKSHGRQRLSLKQPQIHSHREEREKGGEHKGTE